MALGHEYRGDYVRIAIVFRMVYIREVFPRNMYHRKPNFISRSQLFEGAFSVAPWKFLML